MTTVFHKKLVEEIVSQNLCSGCGTCAGVCARGCIHFDSQHSFTPTIDPTQCVNCGLCYKCCPGKGFDFSKLQQPQLYWDDRVGPYLRFVNSYATDDTFRRNGASGGTITAIFQYVLAKKIVDKVLCVSKQGETFSALLTDDVQALHCTQGSKYIPVPLNSALQEVVANRYSIAVVGTPCELQGINSAMRYMPKLNALIKYRVGLFCGFVQPENCLTALRKYLHAASEDWAFDGWRCGEYPGYVRFTNSKTGEQKQLLIYDALNIAVPFYSMEKCFMCPDGLNMSADFSFGDIHSRGHNKNCGIVRTQTGAELIDAMVQDGYLVVEDLSLDDAMKSTVGSVSYMKGMRSLLYIATTKKAHPQYDISFDKTRYSNYLIIQNKIQLSLYRFARKPMVLKFFEAFPALQMRFGRYIYVFPTRCLLYRALKKVVHFLKRK